MTRQFAVPEGTPPTSAGDRWALVGVPAVLTELTNVRRALTAFAASTALPEARVADVTLAAYEAMANVAEHAYPDGTAGTFDVSAVVRDGVLTVTITDRGAWNDSAPDPALRRGRGLALLRACSDTADVVAGPDGTTVVLGWTIPPTP